MTLKALSVAFETWNSDLTHMKNRENIPTETELRAVDQLCPNCTVCTEMDVWDLASSLSGISKIRKQL